jgi:hypothetical protein
VQGAAVLPTRALAALPRDQVRPPPAHLPRCRRRFHGVRFTRMGATRSRITGTGTTQSLWSPCPIVREMVGSRGPLSVVHACGGGARWNKPEHVRTLLALVDAWALLEVSTCTPLRNVLRLLWLSVKRGAPGAKKRGARGARVPRSTTHSSCWAPTTPWGPYALSPSAALTRSPLRRRVAWVARPGARRP